MDKGVKKEPLGKGVSVLTSPRHGFGTDAIVLAHFARAKKTDRAVDLGTGCGIIPFIMLRDGLLESAAGVEISAEAAALAREGAKKNGFDNFTVIESDLKCLKGKLPFGAATLVTCNPPYKATGAGLESRDPLVRAARHETACSLEDAVSVSVKLLQTGGRLVFCQRPERAAELINLMTKYGAQPKRMRLVAKCPGEKPWLVLLEGRRGANIGLVIEPTLYIENADGGFSDEMIKIYGCYKEDHL